MTSQGEPGGQPQTLARTLFFPPNTPQPTFSSFKTSESKTGLESLDSSSVMQSLDSSSVMQSLDSSSVMQSLDSSSVLSKLLKDSLISKMEPAVDENLNITNIVRGDCKYYF